MSEDRPPTLVPTSSMSFEKQILILRAYVVLTNDGTEPVHYKVVMNRTGLARTQIAGTNAFFVSLGLLRHASKGTYLPPPETVQFIGEKPGNEDYSTIRTTLEKSPLFDFIRELIRIHGEVTIDDAISFLLTESGEKTRSRAERSIQWLEKCGILEVSEEGILSLSGEIQ
ncbi:MAG: hypothetical protein JW779_05580 [Candidatus Thorarchaeota archaeon]|nr:hypothetical protein [Candidatus Thorarchaeota archaeon]